MVKDLCLKSQAKWWILDYTDLFSLLGKINTQYSPPMESLWNFGKDKDRRKFCKCTKDAVGVQLDQYVKESLQIINSLQGGPLLRN